MALLPRVRTRRASATLNRPSAKLQPRFELVQNLPGRDPGNLDLVDLADTEARMGQPVRQLTVVGYQQEPLAVFIEPAHGEEPFAAARKQVDNARPSPGIAVGAQVPDGLIEEIPDLTFEAHPFAEIG